MPVLVLLGLAGLLGATQDIASDGVYVTTLGPKEQAHYTGVQSMCWNAGPILANGVLVSGERRALQPDPKQTGPTLVDGDLLDHRRADGRCWRSTTRACCPRAPRPQDAPKSVGDGLRTYVHAFSSFFQKKDIWLMLLLALLLPLRLRVPREDGTALHDRFARDGRPRPQQRSARPDQRRLRHGRLHDRLHPRRAVRGAAGAFARRFSSSASA